MKVTGLIFVLATYFLLLLFMESSIAQDTTTSKTPSQSPSSSQNITCCGSSVDKGKWKGGHQRHHQYWNHNRVSRSSPPTTATSMEEKLKEFASKLGKTPDDLRAAFGKFMLAQGVSMQQIQEEIERSHQVALQIVDSIKKSMHV